MAGAQTRSKAEIKSEEDARRDAQIVSEREKAHRVDVAKTSRLRELRMAKEAENKRPAVAIEAQKKKG